MSNQYPHMISLGRGGAIAAERIVAVARANSMPIRRMVESTALSHILNLTYGEPRQAILILDSGYIAIISMTVEDVLAIVSEASDKELS